MNESLAVLEKYANEKESSLTAAIRMEANALLAEGLDNGYQIQRAWKRISNFNITEILIQVRSRLLDFLLELRGQLPDELDEYELSARITALDTGNLFNSAIFGDHTTIMVGSGGTQSVVSDSVTGDFQVLSRTLQDNGVSDEDIQSLNQAIQEDENYVDSDSKEYGQAVRSWLKLMLSKAVDASWKIEIGVASSLLATALNRYYGWF